MGPKGDRGERVSTPATLWKFSRFSSSTRHPWTARLCFFQGPLGYQGERGFRGESVSFLHDFGLSKPACGGETSTHVIAGYSTVNYANQQRCRSHRPATTQSQRGGAHSVEVNGGNAFSGLFWCHIFILFWIFLSGSTRSQGTARREGLAGKKVVSGTSQLSWWYRGGEFCFKFKDLTKHSLVQ